MNNTQLEKRITEYSPLPSCIVSREGKILSANERISDVFIYGDIVGNDFFAMTGIRITDMVEALESHGSREIERNDKKFMLTGTLESEEDGGNLIVYFTDITEYVSAKKKYRDDRICIAKIQIDNYDEMESDMAPDMRMSVSSSINRMVREWAAANGGSIDSTGDDEYIMYFKHSRLNDMVENKFDILDEIRGIKTETDFPMSLSIGIGVSLDDLMKSRENADEALDLALGRGGDQAVVRDGNNTYYYGGKLQSVEKSNKGKSRVIAHALRRLIDKADRILIMAHKNPDMDAFGSGLGMYRVCKLYGKQAGIVINNVNESLKTIYKKAQESNQYDFYTSERALKLVTRETLLIVLDTHRPSYTECEELITKVDNMVVIDHHRKAADGIPNPILSYIESYASSTSELVSEILQYLNAKKQLMKLEAEALLAGITVDTNSFSVKTGVRTFEAAAWLKRAGADTAEVKRFFQTSLDEFKIRAHAVANADIGEDGIATAICEGINPEAQIINSQVSDELLSVKGVKASFVAGINADGQTVVSGRSLGEVNVQLIMEKLGGGGHLTTAGAQPDLSPFDTIMMIKDMLASREDTYK
ncbi:MAG: DHH family phosphoesterase [Eubacteriales bacterium]|nr:DHH family phosphoesterase [Eubacteriales bacterium]